MFNKITKHAASAMHKQERTMPAKRGTKNKREADDADSSDDHTTSKQKPLVEKKAKRVEVKETKKGHLPPTFMYPIYTNHHQETKRFCEYCLEWHGGYFHTLQCGHDCFGMGCSQADKAKCKTCLKNGYTGIEKHCEYCGKTHWGVLSTKLDCGHIGFGECARRMNGKYCDTCSKAREAREKAEREAAEEVCECCSTSVLEMSMRYCTFCGLQRCTHEECFDEKTSACNDCFQERGGRSKSPVERNPQSDDDEEEDDGKWKR